MAKKEPQSKVVRPQIEVITQEQAILRVLADIQTRLGRMEALLKEK